MQVLRVLATPRWVGWTVLALCAVVVCMGMAYWQLIRAESATGSLLNAGYALQWPLFGVFFALLWWRMLRSEARILAEIQEGPPDAGSSPAAAPGSIPEADSPFTPRPTGVEPGAGAGRPTQVRATDEYNAMLAELGRRDTDTIRNEESTP
ncbi:hypothetical protein GCM10023201_12240 [Actinomycetospora corticicola]|uniref:DNA-binding transcriptional regulator of glucitol operon n=1 Tax=Actinomycetospora corticicola TaxID=663602 RepID=A0A7Y9DZN2_9PSEU|nr:hypothetical protein [Actinomycetospora corticicola]NYD38456.1 DNA-binding transcriptional regulator of glucitol operon [Actinomycetospora corticicola]